DEELSSKVKKSEEADPKCFVEQYGEGKGKKEIDTEGKIQCERCESWIYEFEILDHSHSHSSKVLDWLYLGALRNAKNLKELTVRTNITHILNVAYECQNYFPDKFKYLKIHAEDTVSYDLREDFDQALEFIREARNQGGNVLVHCIQGMSR